MRRRLVLHKHHAKKGRLGFLQAAIRKYGYESVQSQVLVCASDWDYLCDLEKAAIAAFRTKWPDGYNLTDGGEGFLGAPRKPISEERRASMREAMKGTAFALGYRHTEEAKAKIGAAGVGRVFSEERRAKIGATKIGNKYNVGKACSAERRQKISLAQKGKPRFNEAQLAALSAMRRGKPWTAARRLAAERKKQNGLDTFA